MLVKVLHYPKFGLEDEEIDFLLYVEILPYSETVEVKFRVKGVVCRDEDDLKFLKCAVSGKADFLVSGDKDLLSVKEIEGVRIITPAELKRFLK